MNSDPPGLLIDTHYWIWLQSGEKEARASRFLHAVSEAAERGALILSAISVWELALLDAQARIKLSMPCEQWVQGALAMPGLTLAPLSPEIAIESTRLPGEFHGDPADRIIVATARIMKARLATADRRILRYAKRRHVQVL